MSESERIVRIEIIDHGNESEHIHKEIEILYLLEGNLTVTLTGEKFQMNSGDILLINVRKPHALTASSEILLCRVYVDYGMITSQMNRYFVNFWCNSMTGMDEEYHKLRYILNLLINEYKNSFGKETFLFTSIKYSLLECLTKDFSIEGNNCGQGNVGDERVERMLRYVDKNLLNSVSLSEIASELFMSESVASRLFKKVMGITFQDYIIGVRLRCAVEELLYSQKSVTAISESCGFSNPSAFNKFFKKEFHSTPTVYREKHKCPEKQKNFYNDPNIAEKLEKWNRRNKIHEKKKDNECRTIDCSKVLFTPDQTAVHSVDFDLAADLLYSENQIQLLSMKKDFGIKLVRIGGIFHRDMFFIIKENTLHFNFDNIDRVFDFLTKNELIPIVDLTIRQKISFRDIGTMLYADENEIIIFSDLKEWIRTLEVFVQHILFRYGKECVEKWYFELGDSECYHKLCETHGFKKISYQKVWTTSARVFMTPEIKLKFGGELSLLTERNPVSDHSLPVPMPDFITTCIYPFTREDEGTDVYFRRNTDPDFLYSELMSIRRVLYEAGCPNMQIMISEWNTSISGRNFYNDSCAKAAHLMYHMIKCINMNYIFCYRHGSDYQSQYFDAGQPLIGANGLMTKDGIPKPSYFSFLFLHNLYSYVYEKSANFMVTGNKEDGYSLVLCNPRKFSHNYYLKKESEIRICNLKDIFETKGNITFNLKLENLRSGNYWIRKEWVTSESGNVLNEWTNMGSPKSLNVKDVGYLKRICCPRISFSEQKTTDSCLDLNLTLEEDEIMFINIVRIM